MSELRFGTLLTPYGIEEAIKDFIEKWLPTYLAEVERQTETTAGEIVRPASYRVTRQPEGTWPEDTLPAVNVNAAPGEYEQGNDALGQWFDVTAMAVAYGLDEDDARRTAQFYSAAIAALLLQQGSLDGLAENLSPVGMEFADLGDSARSLARGAFTCKVFVPGVVNRDRGPNQPDPNPDPDQPFGDLPTVSEVDVTVEGVPLDGS